MRALIVAVALLMPAFAGCFSEDTPPAPDAQQAASSAQDAGARAGEAPVAPKEAFEVAETGGAKVVAYPAALPSNAARPPTVLDFSGVFTAQDCTGLGLQPVASPWRGGEFSDSLEAGDVYSYEMLLTYENTEDSWAEIHPILGIGSTVHTQNEPFRDVRGPVVVNFTGQGYWTGDDDMAWWGVGCWLAKTVSDVPYSLTLTLSFAEGAVPAQAPILLPVPENATRLFVRGVPVDASKGVLSHWRLFGPDDGLLCECALLSNQEMATYDLTKLKEKGDLVLLVDHTDNGFVSVAFDAPPAANLKALNSEWVVYPLYEGDGNAAVAASTTIEFERVPLLMHAWAQPTGEPPLGFGKKTDVTVTNSRGAVLHIAWGGHLAFAGPFGQHWMGVWPADWAYEVDHHAYGVGEHVVEVTSEGFRGAIELITRQYVR
ncbi:MAG TPA: hypothetical protein VHH36_01325 [Candidatus Thermoplasmatota archaeon]|nr:hypothetical protein [Candidatus Thermoplasmatota archaeon]